MSGEIEYTVKLQQALKRARGTIAYKAEGVVLDILNLPEGETLKESQVYEIVHQAIRSATTPLRELLEKHQWASVDKRMGFKLCSECLGVKPDSVPYIPQGYQFGHAPDCKLKLALECSK